MGQSEDITSAEIIRLHNYSDEWNTNSITIEKIDIIDIFRQIPQPQIDEILLQLGHEVSEILIDIKINLLIDTISNTTEKSSVNSNFDSQTVLD